MEGLLNTREVCELLSCSRTSLWKLRKERGFPAPLKVSSVGLRWKRKQLDQWIEKQKETA